MKKKRIDIVPNEEGQVYRESQNKELHYIRLSQSSLKFSNNFLKKVTLSCLVFGKLEELKDAFSNLKSLPGKLVIKESFTPSDPNDLDRDLKRAGSDDAPICLANDKPIYRTIFYDPTASIEDTLIPHTNVEEIRAFHNMDTDGFHAEDFTPQDTEVSDAKA